MRIKLINYLKGLDLVLLLSLIVLFVVSLFVQYSANDADLSRVYNTAIYFALSLTIILTLATIHVSVFRRVAIPLYLFSIILISLVLVIGVRVNGARRWLNLGIRIQPSEICKISVPLMVAYYFYLRERLINTYKEYIVAFILVLLPFLLIAKEPDLGTSLLVFSSGFFIIFFAGLPFRVMVFSLIGVIVSSPIIWKFLLRDYQKHRIMTLIDPYSDPLGKGYHTIQGITAIGAGGFFGSGYMHGTQTHLNFIPEKHTDFVISVFAEEFGLLGVILLISLYMIIIFRGLKIMSECRDVFSGSLAGSISLSFLIYVVINMGMVSGIFPVVGVPLPFMSYGGTAVVVLSVGIGILMSIHRKNIVSLMK